MCKRMLVIILRCIIISFIYHVNSFIEENFQPEALLDELDVCNFFLKKDYLKCLKGNFVWQIFMN